VNVTRGTLAAGAYSGSIRFVSAAGSITIPVVMQISSGGVSAISDLGQQYILLVDPVTLEAKYQVTARASGGVYSFSFTGVAAGTYKLFAGSDADNNDSICDVGEACGAYISLDSPATVTVSGNRSGLDFFSGYTTSIGANALGAGQPGSSRPIKRLH